MIYELLSRYIGVNKAGNLKRIAVCAYSCSIDTYTHAQAPLHAYTTHPFETA